MTKSKIVTITAGKIKKSYNLKGKTTLNIIDNYTTGINAKNYIEQWLNSIDASGNNVILNCEDNYNIYTITLKNCTSLNSIKINLSNDIYEYTGDDLNTLIYNYKNKITKKPTKGTTINGSFLDDNINLSESGYIPLTKKQIKNNTGLTIKGYAGDDVITGTKYSDNITGGTGITTVFYNKGDGNDIINLTKGENFTLQINDLTFDDLRFEFVNKNKDLRIYTSKTSNEEYIILKNFVKKDITNNANSKKGLFDTSSVELIIGDKTFDLRKAIYKKDEEEKYLYNIDINKNYTGSWLSENISAEDYKIYKYYKNEEGKKELYEVEDWTKKGLTIKTGGGNNNVLGSWYSDTIIGGDGNDTIYGGEGNDKLSGGKGNNTFIFNGNDYTSIDTITDAKEGDIIQINGVNSTDLKYFKQGNNLEIYFDEYFYDADSNKIIVKNYFKSKNKIDKIIVNNNHQETEISIKNITIDGYIQSGTVRGTENNDILISKGNTAKIYGYGGDDTIYASNKKSSIYFYEGDGKDTIINGGGYEFHPAKHTLIFTSGTNLEFTKENYDLNIQYGESGDSVCISNYWLDIDECYSKYYIKIGNKSAKSIKTYINDINTNKLTEQITSFTNINNSDMNLNYNDLNTNDTLTLISEYMPNQTQIM